MYGINFLRWRMLNDNENVHFWSFQYVLLKPYQRQVTSLVYMVPSALGHAGSTKVGHELRAAEVALGSALAWGAIGWGCWRRCRVGWGPGDGHAALIILVR